MRSLKSLLLIWAVLSIFIASILCVKAEEPQTFQIMGKSFDFFNHDTSGTFKLRLQENGDLEYLKSVGDVELISEDLTLYCYDLEYIAKSGEMIAIAWDDRQVKVIQKGTTGYTDKMYHFADLKRTELLGNSQVIQIGPENTTEIFGQLIIMREREDGVVKMNVRKSPVMNYFPNKETAAAEDSTTGTLETENDPAEMKNLEEGLGKNIYLQADKENGEFDMITNSQGGLENFQAYRNVILKSDKLDLDCERLNFKENGEIIEATGAPIFIRQKEVFADCMKFLHYTSEKKSVLTGNPAPRIFQSEEDQMVTMSAPEIVLTENEKGEVSIDLIGQGIQEQSKNKDLPQFEILTRPAESELPDNINSAVKIVPGMEDKIPEQPLPEQAS